MPPRTKITKEDILHKAFEIVRQDGLEALSARRIAKELHCSTKPIYHACQNMEELKQDVIARARQFGVDFIQKDTVYEHPFLRMEMGVINLSDQEKQLFNLLLSSNEPMPDFSFDSQKKIELMKQEEMFQGLTEKQLKRILMDTTIYTQGIITMLHHQSIDQSKQYVETIIKRMLTTLVDWEKEQGGNE